MPTHVCRRNNTTRFKLPFQDKNLKPILSVQKKKQLRGLCTRDMSFLHGLSASIHHKQQIRRMRLCIFYYLKYQLYILCYITVLYIFSSMDQYMYFQIISKLLTLLVQRQEFPRRVLSKPWVLMSWLLAWPGNPQTI